MNAEKFTQKTIETINSAQDLAREKQNQTLMPEHLLYALLSQDGGLIGSLVYRIGQQSGNTDIVGAMLGELNAEIERLPKVTGATNELYPSSEVSAVLRFAEKCAALCWATGKPWRMPSASTRRSICASRAFWRSARF